MSQLHNFFQPLPPGKWIRLLYLQPGPKESPLVAEIATVDLDGSIPVYGAISYVWGDPGLDEELRCKDGTFHITANLAEALRQLRSETVVQAFWADAVCINQEDISEKEHQVNMMGTVYRNAWMVFVCVGYDERIDVETAFALFEEVNSRFEEHITKWNDGFYPPIIEAGDPLMDHSRWRAAAHFFTRPWFGRVWVLQEVGLAIRAKLVCGPYSIEWSKIVEFALISHIHNDLVGWGIQMRFGRIISAFDTLWRSWLKGYSWMGERPLTQRMTTAEGLEGRHSLLNILATGSQFTATDPRDHIYAFLGHPSSLIADTSETFISADYKISEDELYRAVATHLMHHEIPCLAVLQAVKTTTDTLQSSFPSWIPRWSLYTNSNSLGLCAPAIRMFNASRTSETTKECVAEPYHLVSEHSVNVEESSLRVRGLVVGSVRIVSGMMSAVPGLYHKPDSDSGEQAQLNAIEVALTEAKIIESLSDHATPYPNPLNALALTFSAGKDPKGHRIGSDAEIGADFAAFCLARCSQGFYERLEAACSEPKVRRTAISAAKDGIELRYFNHVQSWIGGSHLFVTSLGHYGMVQGFAQPGDLCVVLFGAKTPFILRKVSSARWSAAYRLVGECYLHDFMNGKAIDQWRSGALQVEDIVLV